MTRSSAVGCLLVLGLLAACHGHFVPPSRQSPPLTSDCAGDDDCDDGVACTTDRCDGSGVCTHAPDDGACAPDEVCNPVEGCIDSTHPLFGLDVAISYPGLVEGTLPTYLTHLMGDERGSMSWGPLVSATLTNGGEERLSAEIETTLVGFSTPVVRAAVVEPGASVTLELTPAMDLGALFALTASAPASIRTVVRSEGTPLWEETEPVTLSSRGTALLASERYLPYLSVFVTPRDRSGEVAELVDEARRRSSGLPLEGYGPVEVEHEEEILAGYYLPHVLFLDADETFELSVGYTSASSGTAIYLMSAESYESFAEGGGISGQECELWEPVSGARVSCRPGEMGVYVLVFLNGSSWSWYVQATREATGEEVVAAHLEALSGALRDRGASFVRAAPGFLRQDWQELSYPAETCDEGRGNAYDAAILLAAALEAMGLRPALMLTADHALLAAALGPTTDTVVSLETTMIATAEFADAYAEGWRRAAEENQAGNLMVVDVAAARAEGVQPAPL